MSGPAMVTSVLRCRVLGGTLIGVQENSGNAAATAAAPASFVRADRPTKNSRPVGADQSADKDRQSLLRIQGVDNLGRERKEKRHVLRYIAVTNSPEQGTQTSSLLGAGSRGGYLCLDDIQF